MSGFNRSTDHYDRVRKMMQLAGQDTPSKIRLPSEEVRLLRARLILEEAFETIEALGVVVVDKGEDIRITFGRLELVPSDPARGDPAPDLVEIADGCADISVVTIGTLIACGIPDVKLLRLVDENNLAKFGPGGYRRDDGKWIKPPNHPAPDIAGLLESLGSAPKGEAED